MSSSAKQVLLLILILILPALIYVFLSTGNHNIKTLPIFGIKQAFEKEVDGKIIVDTNYHTIPNFSFLNQYGDTISQKVLDDKITVVDFFFTTCKSICPKMSDQLAVVQEKFRNDTAIIILSHTVNPAYDNVDIMAEYAKEYGAITGKWHFLTGSKKEIYDMARFGYYITALDGDGGEHDFIHSEKLVLVDRYKRIRGYYDGTSPEEVIKLIEDIKLLRVQDFIPKKNKK
jgi:protein SCO1